MPITWQVHSLSPKKQLILGKSEAITDEQIRLDLVEWWQKTFAEVLPAHSDDQWDCLICSLDCYEGTIGLSPLLGFQLRTAFPGCRVHLLSLEEIVQDEALTDEEMEAEIAQQEARYVKLIAEAWNQAKSSSSIASVISRRRIPLQVLNSPEDVPPLLEMILEP